MAHATIEWFIDCMPGRFRIKRIRCRDCVTSCLVIMYDVQVMCNSLPTKLWFLTLGRLELI